MCVCSEAGECCSAQGRLFTRDFSKVSSLSLVQYLVSTKCLIFAHFYVSTENGTRSSQEMRSIPVLPVLVV